MAAITITPGGVDDGIVTGTLNDVASVLPRIGPVVPRLMSTDPPGGGAKPPPATRTTEPGGPLVGLTATELKTPQAPAEMVVATTATIAAIRIGIPRINRGARPETKALLSFLSGPIDPYRIPPRGW